MSGNKTAIKPPREGYKFLKKDGDYRYNQILDYIKEMKAKGEVPTKTDFVTKPLRSVDRDPSEIEMRGYLLKVFGALKDAGLITVYRSSERPYYRLDRGSIRFKNKLLGGQKNEIDTNLEVISPLIDEKMPTSNAIHLSPIMRKVNHLINLYSMHFLMQLYLQRL